jgi:bifunctional polynucleotide phosphatase/kinase
MNPEKRTLLPKMAFSSFASRYRPPRIEEGFQDITTVDFKVGEAEIMHCHV